MITTLSFLGCNSSEQPGSQTAPAEKKTSVVEQPSSTEASKETAPAVAPASESAEQAKESAEQTSAMAGSVAVEQAKESAKEGTEQTSAMAGSVAAEPAKPAEPAAAAASSPAVVQEAVTEAAIPEVLVLKASNGNVTFPHRMHAETHECQTCHGDGTPAAFGITKDIAHKLCKDCHKAVGAGPTACNGCHKK